MSKKGMFSEKQIKKLKQNDEERILQEKKRSKKIQIQCNHIDAETGKSRLKDRGDGTHKCKLCGAVVTTDPKMLNVENIEAAVDMIYSAISISRHELSLKDKFENELIDALQTINMLPEVFKAMLEKLEDKKKKKYNNNNDKNKKKQTNKKKRVKY